jgi:aquaporin Z
VWVSRFSTETDRLGRHRTRIVLPRPEHWPEYLIEAGSLALFMVSAAGFATLLQHPTSPVAAALARAEVSPAVQRIPMGLAMGLTAIAIVYSPFGARSGAHINPAVTLAFLRLGKIGSRDATGYIAAQFAGGVTGILAAVVIFGGLPADPTVNYVATQPGTAGPVAAFLAELIISFFLMSVVLRVSNTPGIARLTGLCVGALVATYIVIEAPLSGMSMNPARTFGANVLAHTTRALWIYFTAPPLGMLLAAELYVRTASRPVRCAKLNHPTSGPCIFGCEEITA